MQVRDRVLDLRRVKASDLRANPKNWRRHPQTQAVALRSVLEKVGYAGALLARETPEGLELIDGHLRQEISGSQEVPVLVVDLDDAEADLILATLDPLGAMAQTDEQALYDLLQGVIVPDDVLAQALEEMTGQAGPPAVMGDPDAIPDLPAEPSTKPGDLYLLGEHRLLCGDAAEPGIVSRVLEGATDQLLVTDPPYGVSYTEVMAGRENQKQGGWKAIENDELRDEKLEGLLAAALTESASRTAFLWFAHDQRRFVEAALRGVGFQIKQEIVWVKSSLVFSRADYHWRHEQAIYATRKGHRQPPTRDQTTVWEVAKPSASIHPTQKPVELYERSIRNHTERGEWVLDPFAGSGTVVIAAEATGRKAAAVEIDPAYCDVIVARWEAFTGQSAERAA